MEEYKEIIQYYNFICIKPYFIKYQSNVLFIQTINICKI